MFQDINLYAIHTLLKRLIYPFSNFIVTQLFSKPIVHARKLEQLQERGLRAVYKGKYARCTQLLERAKLPTLANRHLQNICVLMYEVNMDYVLIASVTFLTRILPHAT